ncbi:hypothetical protein BDF14DRAFT_1794135, partial [Spinellus fusiger]
MLQFPLGRNAFPCISSKVDTGKCLVMVASSLLVLSIYVPLFSPMSLLITTAAQKTLLLVWLVSFPFLLVLPLSL